MAFVARPAAAADRPSPDFCTGRNRAPHAPSRVRPACRCPPPEGSCPVVPRAGRSRALIALAQAPASGARRRPMHQAERALRAAARPRRAVAM